MCLRCISTTNRRSVPSPHHHYMTPLVLGHCTSILLLPFHGLPPPDPHIKPSLTPFLPPHCGLLSLLISLYIHILVSISHIGQFLCCSSQESDCSVGVQMDPISIEKINAMNKYSKSRRQQQQLVPTLTLYMVATFVLCLLLASPAWFPKLSSLLSFFFLTTLPDLATAFLLSPKCLFVVGNLIVAFLVGESRLAPRRELSLVNEIHKEHVKRNTATVTKAVAAAVVVDQNALVGAAEEEEKKEEEEKEEEVKEEEGEEEELHKRVEDFIARVKKQRKLEAKSFFDADR